MSRKIEAMHARFGILPDKRCEDCNNLIKGYCGGTYVRKCTVYGATHSAASDWRKKYVACGLYNREWKGCRIIDVCKSENARARRMEKIVTMDGQIKLEDMYGSIQ